MSITPAFAAQLSDEQLRVELEGSASRLRAEQTNSAVLAAELTNRTRRAAQAQGVKPSIALSRPEVYLQKLTGMSRGEARGMLRVGELLVPSDGEDASPVWMRSVADAVRGGSLSVGQADAIGAGLGEPTEAASVEDLVLAVGRLLELAPQFTVEQLLREARSERENLDHSAVVDAERAIQEARSLKLYRRADGSGRLIADLDREATVLVGQLIDQATGPKRFGPRFVSEQGEAYQEAIAADARTIEQLAHDALFTIIRIGLDVNPNKVPGRRPAVRVVVTEADYDSGQGYGELQGTGISISMATVRRIGCDSGVKPIKFDSSGQPLDWGREKRLFTEAQREAIAIRDGICLDDCDRPASWCETHHIDEYVAHNGLTNVELGVLLCRYHHLDLHNRGARITLGAFGQYFMVERDGTQRQLRSGARIHARIAAAAST
jgi:hypothetical protein